MRRLSVLHLATMLALVGCSSSRPPLPVTGQSVPLSSLDASLPGSAPDVTSGVTSARIARAREEPQNWLTYFGAYDGDRYSRLDQIRVSNVEHLKPAWIFQAGVIGLIATPATYSLEAAPIVVDGVMFLSGWDGYVWALDAETGHTLWRYRHAIPFDVPLCCGNVNRGVAVAQGKVFVATVNGHLVALDARTGTPAWDQIFVDVRAGESATMAPLVVKGMVVVGSSGGEFGVRGHIDSFDLATGERRWRRYLVPKPGEPGSESWGGGDAWARGGGAAWVTGTYDPDLDLLYWGTSNPAPDFDGSVRPGNNLYTDCVVALDPDDGAIRWHYQWTPHDLWDYDGVNENILFDRDGRKLLAHFDKNGYLYVLDRKNGAFVNAMPFGRVTWGTVDSRTGAVSVSLTPTREGTEICPGPSGLKEWTHASYSPSTGLLYTPVIDACGTFKVSGQEFYEGMAYWAGDATVAPGQVRGGAVKAFDPMRGESWTYTTEHPMVSSLLSTAGGLVFAGEPTGEFLALDARTGRKLWSFQTGNGIHGNPVTYSVRGKQYVVVPTGWGGWMKGFAPELYGGNRGSALIAFALP